MKRLQVRLCRLSQQISVAYAGTSSPLCRCVCICCDGCSARCPLIEELKALVQFRNVSLRGAALAASTARRARVTGSGRASDAGAAGTGLGTEDAGGGPQVGASQETCAAADDYLTFASGDAGAACSGLQTQDAGGSQQVAASCATADDRTCTTTDDHETCATTGETCMTADLDNSQTCATTDDYQVAPAAQVPAGCVVILSSQEDGDAACEAKGSEPAAPAPAAPADLPKAITVATAMSSCVVNPLEQLRIKAGPPSNGQLFN